MERKTCGDGYGREITLGTSDPAVAARGHAIDMVAAPEDGIIQARDLVPIFPGRPELHTTMHVSHALLLAGWREIDLKRTK